MIDKAFAEAISLDTTGTWTQGTHFTYTLKVMKILIILKFNIKWGEKNNFQKVDTKWINCRLSFMKVNIILLNT